MDNHEMLEILLESLGTENTLNELVQAMSRKEMEENFEFICRMNDITFGE
jgi:hypothetical protein